MDYIVNHYTNRDEQARFDHKHNLVEFLTTMHYIEKYLTPGARVLEAGAGTGRYSRAIADKGYQVESVELVPYNIEVFKSLRTSKQNINITQGNALDLYMFADDTFDITLVLGPLYHLYTEDDKRKCITEALRVTKPGGIIFAAYVISDLALLYDGILLNRWDTSNYMALGKIDPLTFTSSSTPEDVFELVRKEDIDRLMEPFAVKRLHYVATTLISRAVRDTLSSIDDKTFDMYMRHHFAICERPDMVGMTSHSLDVLRKT
ncbi:MAG: class I SAM-dependent methyltransferase [Defluviitaleaceae bacterium]|nr:class I SAM-dependent methyltransferase [Defluviitaleaceae bacterium]